MLFTIKKKNKPHGSTGYMLTIVQHKSTFFFFYIIETNSTDIVVGLYFFLSKCKKKKNNFGSSLSTCQESADWQILVRKAYD